MSYFTQTKKRTATKKDSDKERSTAGKYERARKKVFGLKNK